MSGKAVLINNMNGLVQRDGLYGYQPLVGGKAYLQSFHCKDYMSDLLYASYHDMSIFIYGYRATPAKIFKEKAFQFVFFSIADFTNVEAANEFIKRLITFMKEDMTSEIIDIIKPGDKADKGILITCPISFCKNNIKMSLFLETMRLFNESKGEDILEFLLKIKKENFYPINCVAARHNLFKEYLKDFDSGVFKKASLMEQGGASTNAVHNYFGIISHIQINA